MCVVVLIKILFYQMTNKSLKNEFDTINNIINNKSNCNNIINININYQNNRYVTPVKAHNGYVYFTGCCVCGKCVGRGETPSCYNNIITNHHINKMIELKN